MWLDLYLYQQRTLTLGLDSMQINVKQSKFMGCISNSSLEMFKVILTFIVACK